MQSPVLCPRRTRIMTLIIMTVLKRMLYFFLFVFNFVNEHLQSFFRSDYADKSMRQMYVKKSFFSKSYDSQFLFLRKLNSK